MFGLGGFGEAYILLFILAGLGLVFINGVIIALFLKIIGMTSGRAVLWGFGVPLASFAVCVVVIAVNVQEKEQEPAPIYIPYPPDGLEDDGE